MRGRVAIAAAAAIAAVLLAALGIWQLERRAWKLDLIARTQARMATAPVAAPARAAWPRVDGDDVYTRVRLSGRWRPVPPVLVKAVTDLGAGRWAMSPLDTPQGTVVINRGFVPDDSRARMPPAAGTVTITGLLRLDEPGGAFLRNNDPAADRWFSRDLGAMARARGWGPVAPFFVDADRRGGGWPRGGMTVVRFPNNHLVYALTWFALAALAGWFAWRVGRGER